MSRICYLKRCLNVLLACSLLCGLMAFPPAQAAGRQPESGEWFYSQLSAANQEAYDAIHAQVEELTQNSTDPSSVSFIPTAEGTDGASIFAFFRDHPEYFWIDSSKLVWDVSADGQWRLGSKVSGESFFCEGFDVGTLPAVRTQFDNQVQAVIDGMPSGDQVTQLRYLNNWMAQHNVYNPLGVGASNYSRCAASGILSNNSEDTAPVCYGYATAFKVLLDAADIPNAYIEGWAYNQNNWPNGEQHAWNYVQVDGVWYAIDPTWDDPKLTTGQARFHYFLVGSETVTETSLSGREQFGKNHEVEKSPAKDYSLSYPGLSKTASDQVVTTGFELIQGGTSQKYSTLEAALSAAQTGGGTVKMWEPATITQTLTIPDGVTLDLNGQMASGGSSFNAVAISGDISPLLSVAAGSHASIVNSSSFTSINTTSTGMCIQNDGILELGTNIKIASGKPVLGGSALTSPIGGNEPQYASNSYTALNPNSPYLLFAYLVIQPTFTSGSTYQANGRETVQDLIDGTSGSLPSLKPQYYGTTGSTLDVPTASIPSYTWSVGRSPNDGNHVLPDDPLENGDYVFVTTLFGYPVTYTVTVSGVPDAPKQYTVTVNGGNSATGGGTYEEGAPVTVSAGTKEGYTFQSWTAEGIALDNDTQPTVSFTMPANDVTLTANFKQDNTISIAAAALAPKTYDGTTAATVESVTFNGGTPIKDIDYTATAVFDDADAGTGKTAIVTVTLLNGNYTFADGKTTASYTLNNQTIDKATYSGETTVSGFIRANTSAEVNLPRLPDGATFGNPVYSVASDTIVRAEITGNTLSYEGGSGIVKDTEYTVTVPVNGGRNYNDYDLTVTLTGTEKELVEITGVTAVTGLVYNGMEQMGYTGTPSTGNYIGDVEITYSSGSVPVDAGDYTVTIAIPEDVADYAGSLTLSFTIEKATVTVTAPGREIYVGQEIPDLSGLSCDIKGLVGNDIFEGVTLSYEGRPDSNQPGSYTIVPSGGSFVGGNADNYTVQYENGMLTVQSNVVTSYLVTVNGGTGGGLYQAGDTVTVTAETREGYTFQNWTASGVVLSSPTSATVTFTMPANAVTLTASWFANSTGGSSSSSGNKTETIKNPDGSTTTTVTKPDGSTTETTKWPDGSKEVVETKKDGTVTTTTTDAAGNKTEVVQNTDGSSKTTVDNKDGSDSVTVIDEHGKVVSETTLSQSAVEAAQGKGEAVALPMPELPVTTDRETAPTVTVGLPTNSSVKVEIPVKNVTSGTVAVIVKADGTEEVVKTSLTTENGVVVTLSDGDTVKIVDNSRAFADVPDGYWGADGIAFASSRELMSGTGDNTFAPETAMTRGMMVTLLARLDGVDTSKGGIWYEAGRQWAMEKGISDGTDLDQSLTREQLAAMLYRYAGQPVASEDLRAFTDGDSVSDWAQSAMVWAVKSGILTGTSTTTLSPQDTATRAQVATILMRFCENM